jgi:hypothetical protein
VPDQNTIWLFREKGITAKNGTIQDATFITSDTGHKRKDRPEVVDPEFRPVKTDNNETTTKKELKEEKKNAETRRSKDVHGQEKNNK